MRAHTTKPLTTEQAAELWAGFGQPPVLSSENKEHSHQSQSHPAAG